MFAIKIIVDNLLPATVFHLFLFLFLLVHYMVASIVMSYKIMTSQCVLKGFKAEEKTKPKKHVTE